MRSSASSMDADHGHDFRAALAGKGVPGADVEDHRARRVVQLERAQLLQPHGGFRLAPDMVHAGPGIGARHRLVAAAPGARVTLGRALRRVEQRVPVVAAEGQQAAQQLQVGLALELARREQRQHLLQPGPAALAQQGRAALRQDRDGLVPGTGARQVADGARQVGLVLGGAAQQPRHGLGLAGAAAGLRGSRGTGRAGASVSTRRVEHADEQAAALDLVQQPRGLRHRR